MIRDLMTLQDRMNRLFDEAFPARTSGRGEGLEFYQGAWTPAVDIFEDENAIHLKADIPGVDPNNLDIRIEGNTLFLKGERSFEKEMKKENFYRVERSYGTFSRSFTLPHSVQSDRIEAHYRNGVLDVAVPKREDAKPKQVKIQTESEQARLR